MKLLLYCTKAKPYLVDERKMRYHNFVLGDNSVLKSNEKDLVLNGKIVAECDFEVEEIYELGCGDVFRTKTLDNIELAKKSCLYFEEISEYLYSDYKDSKGYAIHIENLHIFNKSKELSEFVTKRCQYAICSTCKYGKDNIKCATIDNEVDKAPQNMMYCYGVDGKRYVLISIKPEWLCKILNGEKTIEVRKKVLKEMLKND